MTAAPPDDLFGPAPDFDRALAEAAAIETPDHLDLGPDRRLPEPSEGLRRLGWLLLGAVVAGSLTLFVGLWWQARDRAADLEAERDRLAGRLEAGLDDLEIDSVELTEAQAAADAAQAEADAAIERVEALEEELASTQATIDALPRPALPPTALDQIAVETGAGHVALRPGALGVVGPGGAYAVVSVDSNEVIAIEAVPDAGGLGRVAVEGGEAWIAAPDSDLVHRVRPADSPAVTSFAVTGPRGVQLVGDEVWVASAGDAALVRFDRASGAELGRVDLPGPPAHLEVDDTGAVAWLTGPVTGIVMRVDVATGAVDTVPVGDQPAGLTMDGADVWVSVRGEDEVVRVDGATATVADTVPVPGGPGELVVLGEDVWVLLGDAGQLARVDPDLGQVVSRTTVGAEPRGLAVGHGSLWVGLAGEFAVLRVTPPA